MRRAALLISLWLCHFAVAAPRVCMGGDLDRLSQAERASCERQVRLAGNAAASVHALDSWHLVVVCGDDGWRNYADFAGVSYATLDRVLFRRDVPGQTVFLRGTSMTSEAATYDLVVRSLRFEAEAAA